MRIKTEAVSWTLYYQMHSSNLISVIFLIIFISTQHHCYRRERNKGDDYFTVQNSKECVKSESCMLKCWMPMLGLCSEYLKKDDVRIKTTTGEIKGKIEVVSSQDVLSFLGIPYAEPPIAGNRFKKPIPIKPWKGVLETIKKPPACMQGTTKDFGWVARGEQNENCLYLNVWTPRRACTSEYLHGKNSQLPVMVLIHGGGFYSGSSNIEVHDGAILAASGNVIVASMNYRVGAFGFLYAGTSEAPGNMGLHDQHLALEWIRNNAKSFCGDPEKITLFGSSAGSMSVGFHIVSPKSRNLFKRAIMESGSPYNILFNLPHDLVKLQGSQFANALGCANNNVNLFTDPDEVVSCLREVAAESISRMESLVLENSLVSFLPIYGDDFLPKSAIELINTNDYTRMEILLGTTLDEGAVFLNFLMPDVFTRETAPDFSVAQARFIIEDIFRQSLQPTAKEVAGFYLSNVTEGNFDGITDAIHNTIGDWIFVCPSIFLAEKLTTENDVFYYLFTHKPSNTVWGDWIDVGHFEEVPFVFGVPLKSKSYTYEEDKFSYDIMQIWTAFARDGRPLLLQEEWPPYGNAGLYKELNPNSHNIGKRLRGEACEFWRKYYL